VSLDGPIEHGPLVGHQVGDDGDIGIAITAVDRGDGMGQEAQFVTDCDPDTFAAQIKRKNPHISVGKIKQTKNTRVFLVCFILLLRVRII
jgi:hypothetical protein